MYHFLDNIRHHLFKLYRLSMKQLHQMKPDVNWGRYYIFYQFSVRRCRNETKRTRMRQKKKKKKTTKNKLLKLIHVYTGIPMRSLIPSEESFLHKSYIVINIMRQLYNNNMAHADARAKQESVSNRKALPFFLVIFCSLLLCSRVSSMMK